MARKRRRRSRKPRSTVTVASVAYWGAAIVLLGVIVVFGPQAIRNLRDRNTMPEPVFMQQLPNGMFQTTAPARPHYLIVHNPVEAMRQMRRTVTYEYSRNNLGGRGGHVTVPKPPGRFRVVILGECVTFGVGVADDEAYPALLQGLLRERLGTDAIEVVNMGYMGGTPKLLAIPLEDEVVRADPDLLVLAPGAATIELPEHTGVEPLRVQLTEPEYARYLDEYRQQLRSMLRFADKKGWSRYLITPTFSTFFGFDDGLLYNAALVEVADERGIAYLDTTTAFREVEAREGLTLELDDGVQRVVQHGPGGDDVLLKVRYTDEANQQRVAPEVYELFDRDHDVAQKLFIDGNHPNVEGHQLLAELLADALDRAGLLPDAGATSAE